MKNLEKIILARNGKEFLLNWQKSFQKEKEDLERKGFLVKNVLGHGGRGVVLLVETETAEKMAAKVFVYKDELIPQREALSFWQGFSPRVIKTFSDRTLILKYIDKETDPVINLECGLNLIQNIIKRSPHNKGRAQTLNDYFSIRLLRANERNRNHGLYSKKEISLIEKMFFAIKKDKPYIVHGDFSPGNVLTTKNSDHLVIDPRSFLWGDISVDISKWILTYKKGAGIQKGIDFFKKEDLLKPGVIPWLLFQAYDDSSAFASFPLEDMRIEKYKNIVQDILS